LIAGEISRCGTCAAPYESAAESSCTGIGTAGSKYDLNLITGASRQGTGNKNKAERKTTIAVAIVRAIKCR